MSIGMTQALVFETDDLNHFKTMLEATCPVLFNFRAFRPMVVLNNPEMVWRDGRYENWEHSTHVMLPVSDLIEADNVHLLQDDDPETAVLTACATYGGAKQMRLVCTKDDKDEAARYCCSQEPKPQPTRKWITSVEEYHDTHRDASEFVPCKTHKQIVQVVMDIIDDRSSEAEKKKFRDEFAHAEPRHFDGSIGIGYRMEWRPSGALNMLDVSMVHALYGK